jgi:hypothetical protein
MWCTAAASRELPGGGHIHDSEIGEPSQQLCICKHEQYGCLGEVHPQDVAAGSSGLGAALAASRSGVRTGRRSEWWTRSSLSGLYALERGRAQVCGAEVFVSKSPCDHCSSPKRLKLLSGSSRSWEQFQVVNAGNGFGGEMGMNRLSPESEEMNKRRTIGYAPHKMKN